MSYWIDDSTFTRIYLTQLILILSFTFVYLRKVWSVPPRRHTANSGPGSRNAEPGPLRRRRAQSENQPEIGHRKQVWRATGAELEHVVAGQREAVSRRSLGGARVSLRAGTANESNFRSGS